VQETNFGTLPVQLFVPIEIAVRAGGGVQKGQPTGAASIVSHAQEQGSAARRHVFARLVAEFDVRSLDTTELAASTHPDPTSTEE
jgi:hypothetical protein